VEYVTDPATIEGLYGPVVRGQRQPHLGPEHADFLAEASMVVVATVAHDGLTCSPRGGPAGTLGLVHDPSTLWLPDAARGRVHQTVRNLMGDPRVGLVFLAAGRHESLRIQGLARVTVDPQALQAFPDADPPIRSVLVVDVQEVRLSGRGPVARSGLWGAADLV
jgi:uncharacterized protein